MSPEITSYNTYGEYNERNGRYVGMSNAGWKVYNTLTNPNKILLRDGLKMLMKQVFEDKKLDLPAINNMRSRSAQNDQYIYIESIKKQAGNMHDFIGKLTIGHDTYFIKLVHQWKKYTPYAEHKTQDILNQLLYKHISLYNGDGQNIYVHIAEPLYSFTKVKTTGFSDGFIIYPFQKDMQLLGDSKELTKKYYSTIIDTIDLDGLRDNRIREMNKYNISYRYNDDGSILFTVFDWQINQNIDKVHNLYPHAPRPPKPPRHTNI